MSKLALLSAFVPMIALADPPDPVQAARSSAERAAEAMRAGDELLKKDDLRGACAAYEDAIKALPSWWMPRLAAARCGRVIGMPVERLLEHAAFAVRARPQITITHVHYGLALEEAGRIDEAIVAYESALRVHAGLVDARYRLGLLLTRRGEFRTARRHLEEVLQSRPEYVVARVHLVRVLEKLGDIEGAEAGYRELVVRSRYPARALSQLARFYERHNNPARAKAIRAQYDARFGKPR